MFNVQCAQYLAHSRHSINSSPIYLGKFLPFTLVFPLVKFWVLNSDFFLLPVNSVLMK